MTLRYLLILVPLGLLVLNAWIYKRYKNPFNMFGCGWLSAFLVFYEIPYVLGILKHA